MATQTPTKKLIIGSVAAFSLTIGLVGCAGSPTPSTSASTSDTSSEAAEQAAPAESNADSKYGVEILGSTLGSDYQGEPVIIVDYEFTNNSEEAVSFMIAVSAKAFQNGVELSGTTVVDGVDISPQMSEIKPGATITVQDVYLLSDDSTVTVEVTELISFDDTILATKEFSVV